MSDPGIFIIAVIVPLSIILGIFIPQQLKREEKKRKTLTRVSLNNLIINLGYKRLIRVVYNKK